MYSEKYDPCDYWSDDVIYDAKQIAALMGITIDKVYFSGFWSQGDGACFTGHLGYDVDCLEKVMEYAPQDKELHEIATRWVNLRCPELEGRVTHSSRYYHSNSVSFSIEEDQEVDENAVIIAAKQLMDWIYGKLEKNYNFAKADSYARGYQELEEEIIQLKLEACELIKGREAHKLPAFAEQAVANQIDKIESDMLEKQGEMAWLEENFHYWEDKKSLTIQEFVETHL